MSSSTSNTENKKKKSRVEIKIKEIHNAEVNNYKNNIKLINIDEEKFGDLIDIPKYKEYIAQNHIKKIIFIHEFDTKKPEEIYLTEENFQNLIQKLKGLYENRCMPDGDKTHNILEILSAEPANTGGIIDMEGMVKQTFKFECNVLAYNSGDIVMMYVSDSMYDTNIKTDNEIMLRSLDGKLFCSIINTFITKDDIVPIRIAKIKEHQYSDMVEVIGVLYSFTTIKKYNISLKKQTDKYLELKNNILTVAHEIETSPIKTFLEKPIPNGYSSIFDLMDSLKTKVYGVLTLAKGPTYYAMFEPEQKSIQEDLVEIVLKIILSNMLAVKAITMIKNKKRFITLYNLTYSKHDLE